VVPGVAVDVVRARATGESVVARAAEHRVGTEQAVGDVPAGTAVQLVVARTADDGVVAAVSVERIDLSRRRLADDLILARAAAHFIGTLTGCDEVVTAIRQTGFVRPERAEFVAVQRV